MQLQKGYEHIVMGLNNNRVNIQICSMVVYMCSSLLHKADQSRDLTQAQ